MASPQCSRSRRQSRSAAFGSRTGSEAVPQRGAACRGADNDGVEVVAVRYWLSSGSPRSRDAGGWHTVGAQGGRDITRSGRSVATQGDGTELIKRRDRLPHLSISATVTPESIRDLVVPTIGPLVVLVLVARPLVTLVGDDPWTVDLGVSLRAAGLDVLLWAAEEAQR